MAKNKHATTLFEVLKKDVKSTGKSGAKSFQLPKWFSQAAAKPVPSRALKTSLPVVPPAIASMKITPAAPVVGSKAAAPVGQPWGAVLREWFKENRRTAVPSLCGAAAAILLIALVVFFRHPSKPIVVPGGVLVPTEELRRGPKHPEVLEVHGKPLEDVRPSAPRSSVDDPLPAVAATEHPDPAPAAAVTSGGQVSADRQPGLNYMLVQSYGDEKTANEARDFLVANNIPCTVERNLSGWRKDFYYVIGLDAFEKPSTPDFRAYKTRLETLSTTFAPKGGYRAFRPMAIKWK